MPPAPPHPSSRLAPLARGAAGVALGLWLAGCDAPSDSPAPTRIELWTIDLRARFSGLINAQISRFEAQNPGVQVRWVDVPFTAMERKLIAAAAAGRAPDVVNMSDVNFARFAALGAFRDITTALPEPASSRYLPGALGICVLDQRVKALPWYLTPQARLVNTELLERGGLDAEDLPVEWSALARLAGPFHDRTGTYLFSQPLGEESQLPIMLLAEGLVPFEPNPDDPTRLRARLATPSIEEYLRTFVELYASGALPRESATRGHSHLTDLYQEGRVAVINTGPNFVSRIAETSPEVFDATDVLPGMVGRLGRVHLPVMVLAVTSQSKHPQQAAALAWEITGPRSQGELARLVPVMPSTIESLTDPYFHAGVTGTPGPSNHKLALARAVSAATLPTATGFTASLECWPDLRRSFEDSFKRVLLGGMDLHAGLERIQADWNRILSAAGPSSIDSVPRPSAVQPVDATPARAEPR